MTPYYNKYNQNELFEHYKLIEKNINTPIILYNVPSRKEENIEKEPAVKL